MLKVWRSNWAVILRLEVDWPTAGPSSTGVLTRNLLNHFRKSEQLIHRLIKVRDCPSIN